MRAYLLICFAFAWAASLPIRIQDVEIPPPEIPLMIEYGVEESSNVTMRNQIRPGMLVTNYDIELEADRGSGTFSGRAVIRVTITDPTTREDEIVFHVRDLNINSVRFAIAGGSTLNNADYDVDDDDGILEIETGSESSLYDFHIEYTGTLTNVGTGFWAGEFLET